MTDYNEQNERPGFGWFLKLFIYALIGAFGAALVRGSMG